MGKFIVAAAGKKRNWQIENLTCESFLQNIVKRVAVMRGFTLFKHCRGVGFKMPKNTFIQFKDEGFGAMKLLIAIFISMILKLLQIVFNQVFGRMHVVDSIVTNWPAATCFARSSLLKALTGVMTSMSHETVSQGCQKH